jgi:hypothetical protein
MIWLLPAWQQSLQLRDEAFLRGSTSWLSAQAIMPPD